MLLVRSLTSRPAHSVDDQSAFLAQSCRRCRWCRLHIAAGLIAGSTAALHTFRNQQRRTYLAYRPSTPYHPGGLSSPFEALKQRLHHHAMAFSCARRVGRRSAYSANLRAARWGNARTTFMAPRRGREIFCREFGAIAPTRSHRVIDDDKGEPLASSRAPDLAVSFAPAIVEEYRPDIVIISRARSPQSARRQRHSAMPRHESSSSFQSDARHGAPGRVS